MGLCGGVHTDRDRYSDSCQWVSNPFLPSACGKVMFSQASVSHSVHGGRGACMATGADGTHPTKMHSCISIGLGLCECEHTLTSNYLHEDNVFCGRLS